MQFHGALNPVGSRGLRVRRINFLYQLGSVHISAETDAHSRRGTERLHDREIHKAKSTVNSRGFRRVCLGRSVRNATDRRK